MGLQSPVHALPLHVLVVSWMALIAATLGYAALLKTQGDPLVPTLPHGIVSLEVPWSSEAASGLVRDLQAQGLTDVARRQVQLDFAFVVLYPLCLALGCFVLAQVIPPGLAIYGLIVGWAVLLCAPLDAIENLALLRMLEGRTGAPWPQLSTVCAAVKFGLVFGALLFTIVGVLAFGSRCLQKVC